MKVEFNGIRTRHRWRSLGHHRSYTAAAATAIDWESNPLMSRSADCNLLFGLLALQNNFIDRDALLDAFSRWVHDRAIPLGQILRDRGALSPDEHDLLQALVAKHLEKFGGDPEKSLQHLSSIGSLRQDLSRIADVDVQARLTQVSAAHQDDDPYRTVPQPSVGDSTSAGSRFRILRPHAKGGLGQISVALDQELDRPVALKEIQDRHADEPHSRARFVQEAEITGKLEHPGIIPVYGLGHYADGRPFYAMRFIKGDSLMEAIAAFHADESLKRDPSRRALRLRELLRRFQDVCNAIAYAHSRGVLHRDLKPGNIMLGPYGETLVVDWGLAKPMGQEEESVRSTALAEGPIRLSGLSGSRAETVPGSMVGTPAYASPEQVTGQLHLLKPASDVYSLGATLYCLLTGRVPFAGDDIGELLGKVQRGELVRPRLLDPSIDPALEAVCLKAMALEPGDRYASCRALAENIERWMADEPVSAYREPLSRRARRWANRNRTAVTAAAVALVLGVVGTTLGLIEARRQEQQAAKRLAQVTKMNDILGSIFKDLDPKNAQKEIGLFTKARATFTAALGPDHADTFRSMNNLANSYREAGQHDRAIKLHEETLALQRAKLGPDHLDTLTSMNNLANSYHDAGQHDRALKLREETLALMRSKLGPGHPYTLMSMNNLANSYAAADQLDRAIKLFEETLALRKAKLGPDHPSTLESLEDQARCLANTGQVDRAGAILDEVIASRRKAQGDGHPETFQSRLARADLDLARGRLDAAEAADRAILDDCRTRLGPDDRVTIAAGLALARVREARGDRDSAAALDQAALESARKNPTDRDTLAAALTESGRSRLGAGEWTTAEALLREALAIREAEIPQHWRTAEARSLLGGALLGQKKAAEAAPLLRSGYEGMARSAAAIPLVDRPRLAEALDRLIAAGDAAGTKAELAAWKAERAKLGAAGLKP
jgi:serine/threonine protein kinase